MADIQAVAGALRANLSGDVLVSGDSAYDTCRRVHNGMIDRNPGLIARCRGVGDVQAAVRAAREHQLEIAVRGGGHNVAGNAVCDDGLMIDLAGMRGVHVDPQRVAPAPRAAPPWGDYNRETQLFGLASTGGVVSSTGVAGLTLGGGLGWLMGKQGWRWTACVRPCSSRPTGEVVRASADEHPDLFWAIRGGGGNFGVATWLEFEVAPVGPMVTGGLVAIRSPRPATSCASTAISPLNLPDELSAFAGLLHAPDGSGDQAGRDHRLPLRRPRQRAGRTAPLQALRFACDGRDWSDAVFRRQHDVRRGFPRGALNYWKSNFLAALTDAGD